jgi:hypothetical protein
MIFVSSTGFDAARIIKDIIFVEGLSQTLRMAFRGHPEQGRSRTATVLKSHRT